MFRWTTEFWSMASGVKREKKKYQGGRNGRDTKRVLGSLKNRDRDGRMSPAESRRHEGVKVFRPH